MRQVRERGWIRTLVTGNAATLRLVCFAHSGGSATAFHGWAAAVPPGVELLAVQYPGRSDRIADPLVDDVVEMAGHVAAELYRLPDRDQVLFGHSLGAVVAYETALLLRDRGREPRMLCLSSSLPPGQMANRSIHTAPDEEFWDELCALGGIDPAVAQDLELRELVTPAIRSDLRAHATYRPRADAKPLSCPVRCFHGVGDPLVDEQRLPEWAAVTSGEFTLRIRPGGHFHVTENVPGLIADIVGVGSGW
jgi:pyochelin biosynthesis protein PchC